MKQRYINVPRVYTGLCSHKRLFFYEMSSWTALTTHLGMKTIVDQKYIKQICSDFYMMILNFPNIIRKCILTNIGVALKPNFVE